MAFTLEDGTGIEGANAYIDEDFFNVFHGDRGIDTGFSDTEVQQHVIRASDYVDKRFGRRFRGDRLSHDQGREWPRTGAFDDADYPLNGVPDALKFAIAEYTLLSLQLDRNLAPMPAPDFGVQNPETGTVTNTSAGKILQKREEVGPIVDDTRYAAAGELGKPMTGTGNLTQNLPEYPQADLWIEELIEPYSNRSLSRG